MARVRSLARPRTDWLARVRDALQACGVVVPLDAIGRRTSAEIMRAHAWASFRESHSQLPSWLRPFVTVAPRTERRGQLSLVIDPRRNP